MSAWKPISLFGTRNAVFVGLQASCHNDGPDCQTLRPNSNPNSLHHERMLSGWAPRPKNRSSIMGLLGKDGFPGFVCSLTITLGITRLCRNRVPISTKFGGLSFDSPLSRDDRGPITEPLIPLAFLPSVPKSGKRTSAPNLCRGEWMQVATRCGTTLLQAVECNRCERLKNSALSVTSSHPDRSVYEGNLVRHTLLPRGKSTLSIRKETHPSSDDIQC